MLAHAPGGSRPEAVDVEAGRRHLDPVFGDALEQQRGPRSFGGRQEQVGLLEQELPTSPGAPVAERVEQRQGLPDGQHEPVAARVLVPRRLRREPVRELLGVDDVGSFDEPVETPIAIADHVRREIAQASRWREVTHRPRADQLDRELLERVGIAPRLQVADVEPVGQELPGPQLPGRRLVPADDDDSCPSVGHDRAAYAPRRAASARR